MVDMLFSLYSDASGMAHTGRDGGHRDCSWLLRRFYTAAGMLLQVDVPAADFFPAMDRFLHRYDASVVPLENYYPSPPPSAVRWTSARRATACSASPMKPRLPLYSKARHRRSGRRAGYRLAAIALARVGADARERLDGWARWARARIATTCSASWGGPTRFRPGAGGPEQHAEASNYQRHRGQHLHATPFYAATAPPRAAPGLLLRLPPGSELPRCAGAVLDDKGQYSGKTVYGELNSLLQNVTDRMYIAPELGGARPGS